MKIAGIVCEYNPFHSGHKYHIEETRKLGADAVVCVMSSNVCQRGEFPLFDKFSRAEAAVRNGADLVLELPAVYAVSPAPDFALGAVSVLDLLGCVSMLSFGSETGDISRLEAMLSDFESENGKVKEALSKGVSFPKALSETSDAPLLPNDILALEYLRALKKLSSEMVPTAVIRKGVSHDNDSSNGSFASADHIRKLTFKESFDSAEAFIPKEAFDIFRNCMENGKHTDRERLSLSVLSYLKRLSVSHIKKAPEISEGLENRIFAAIKKAETLEELINSIKTKRYTMAKIKRIIMNIYLGIEKGDSKISPPYIRVLASNKKGNEILKAAKKTARVPVIHNLSKAGEISAEAKRLCGIEEKVSDLFSFSLKNPSPSSSDFHTKNIVLTDESFPE